MKTDSKRSNHNHFWQTLEERTTPPTSRPGVWETPEFQTSVNEMVAEKKKSNFSRRSFFKYMGAGAVMMGAACRRPTEQIVPAVIQPPEMVPGNPVYYSSTTPDGTGIIVKTREGRPIKISGNPDHPLSRGGVSAYNVAGTMDLYDPDRLRRPVTISKGKAKRANETVVVNKTIKNLEKGDYVLLTEPVNGPTSRALVNDFLNKYPGGRHLELRADPTLRQIADAQSAGYGKALIPNYRIEQAEYILSIDGDFLGTMPGPGSYNESAFGRTRNLKNNKKKMSRLVVFESMFSLTGSNADERFSLRPGDQHLVALALAAELSKKNSKYASALLKEYSPANVAAKLGHSTGLFKTGNFEVIIKRIAAEIWEKRGRSLVLGASPLAATGNDGQALQIAVNLLNSILDNDGVTVDHVAPAQLSPGASDKDLRKLLADISSGKVKTVILAGANPVYHLPASWKVKEALQKATYTLSLSDRINESARAGKAILPVNHYLESWGDAETIPGVFSIQQPVIRPLYKTRSFEDRLIQLAGGSLGGASSFHDYLKAAWAKRKTGGGSFNDFWVSVLQAGYVAPSVKSLSAKRSSRSFKSGSLSALPAKIDANAFKLDTKKLTLGLYYNVQVLDGTGANNSYRQELPDPVTKVVWENCVSVLPETARQLGLKQGSIVEVQQGKQAIKLPVHLQPGIHPGAALVALGYGRTSVGRVADALGANALDLVASGDKNGDLKLSGFTVELKNSGDRKELANTQKVYRNGFNQEDKMPGTSGLVKAPYGSSGLSVGPGGEGAEGGFSRPLIRETTIDQYKKSSFNAEKDLQPPAVEYPKEKTKIMSEWEYTGLRWHMVVDLSSCTGCGSCVTSCNIENNIPMVGPEEVAKGREMHWLRIDRYYKGPEDSPEVAHQPMLCQHCENAPCENVCPVAATTHNSEGLNIMTYNRCVGTRYCANNCPYKVRRFNWFENWTYMDGLEQAVDIRNIFLHNGADHRPQLRSPQQLGQNPDVTTRSRGIMEKCSFCVHRIASARQDMKARGDKQIRDGEMVTACQEVCPTNAISFGDINDRKSEVHNLVKTEKGTEKGRGYGVLEFLGVKPQVTYLAKVRNKDKA